MTYEISYHCCSRRSSEGQFGGIDESDGHVYAIILRNEPGGVSMLEILTIREGSLGLTLYSRT